MKRAFLTLGLAFCLLMPTMADAGPAQDLAQKMIEAHGGMDRWAGAPTVSYEHTLIAPGQEEDPWVARELIEQGKRRVVQEWPRDEAVLVYDGTDVWTTGWKRGNPPKFMTYVSYHIMNLPWLTQDSGVVLAPPGKGSLPTGDKEYLTLKLTYDPKMGESEYAYYTLFIDPESYLMKGVEFVVTYGALLDAFGMPEDVHFMGPMFKVFEEVATVDGLVVPTSYTTYSPDGEVYGRHTAKNWSFKKPFDESRMKRPDTAVTDESSAKRGQGAGE